MRSEDCERDVAPNDELLPPGPSDRVLVLAPHPDDETLGAGGLLAAAAENGAAIRIVFLTLGENNPWAQRATERRLLVLSGHRTRFGERRRVEAGAALERLGVAADASVFLEFPDQGLTHALLSDPATLQRALAREIERFLPTMVLGPSNLDLHPDHNALAVAQLVAMHGMGAGVLTPRTFSYVIHNPALRRDISSFKVLGLSPSQSASKRAAIEAHRTQLALRAPLLRSFAVDLEGYVPFPAQPRPADHPIRDITWAGDTLVISAVPQWRFRAFGPTSLVIASGAQSRFRIALAWGVRHPRIEDLVAREVAGHAGVRRDGPTVEITLPAGLLRRDVPFGAKISRRFGFFDEAGWRLLLPETA